MGKQCKFCKEPAKIQCSCKKIYLCSTHAVSHQKEPGKHTAVSLHQNQPRKAVSFDEQPELADRTSLEEIKGETAPSVVKGFIEKETVLLEFFQGNIQTWLHGEEAKLSHKIILETKKATNKFIEKCDNIEGLMAEALELLNVKGEIPLNNSVIQRIQEVKSKNKETILLMTSEVKGVEFECSDLVNIQIELANNPLIESLKEYYKAWEDSVPVKLDNLYKKILAEKHYTMKVLDLSQAKLTKNHQHHLVKLFPLLEQLEQLKLTGNKFGSEGAEQLNEALLFLPNLRKLLLSNNDLRGKGIESLASALANFNKVLNLNLSKNNLGATGSRYLSQYLPDMASLEDLNLDNNGLGVEGSRYLAAALPKCLKLKSLSLKSNSLSEGCIKFFKGSLGRMNNLKVLKLGENSLSSEDKRTIQNIVNPGCRVDF